MECDCITFQDVFIGFFVALLVYAIYFFGYFCGGSKDD